MLRKFYQKHRNQLEKLDQFLLGNPIVERGLVLAPIVVTCTSLNNALILSGAFAVITILTIFITWFVPKNIPYTFRVILNAALASLIFVPISALILHKQPNVIYSLGVYLPLLTTNSLIVQKSESRYHKEKLSVMLVQLLTASLGFAAIAVIIGTVREILGKGTLLGKPLAFITQTTPALLLPFGGFILLGFLAAILQKFRKYLNTPPAKKKRKESSHV